MQVLQPMSMATMARRLQTCPLALVAAAGGPPLLEVLATSTDALAHACSPTAAPVLILIGPEGDFTGTF